MIEDVVMRCISLLAIYFVLSTFANDRICLHFAVACSGNV